MAKKSGKSSSNISKVIDTNTVDKENNNSSTTGSSNNPLTEEQVEGFKKGITQALESGDFADKILQVKEDQEKELMETFSREILLASLMENEEGMSPENALKFSKALANAISAESRGEEPDLSELISSPFAAVEEAVNNYIANEPESTFDNLYRRIVNLKKLFTEGNRIPSAVNQVANEPYRYLTRRGKCRFQEENLGWQFFFKDQRDYKGEIDAPEVEKILRRIDSEVRLLDPVVREEFSFNFSQAIMATVSTSEFRGISSLSSDDFHMLSEDTRRKLHELVLFYFYARAIHQVYMRGYNSLNRNFNEAAIQDVSNLRTLHPSQSIINEESRIRRNGVRTLNEEEYVRIAILNKALYAALPDKFKDAVRAAIQVDSSLHADFEGDNTWRKLEEASRYMRTAFINITQSRGSFENFFTTILQYYNLLKVDLNDKVELSACMVGLYDSLGLDIPEVLQQSTNRILEKLPF